MDIGLIPFSRLLIAFIPVLIVAIIFYRWSLSTSEIGIAAVRMVTQLLLIGYVLAWLFETKNLLLLGMVLLLMSLVSTWISLRKIKHLSMALYFKTMLVILLSSLFSLFIVVGGVLMVEPVEHSRIVIPLAGMIFSNAMTAVGLAAERYASDTQNGASHIQARNSAFNASLIPIINAMLAVGLVALPGMMTGQILSGVSPLIAVRYQIVVMCMIFGVVGLSSAAFLQWVARDIKINR